MAGEKRRKGIGEGRRDKKDKGKNMGEERVSKRKEKKVIKQHGDIT